MARETGLSASIANRIKEDLPQYQGSFLPTVSQLCESFSVSRTTMVAALALLQQWKLTRSVRGRRTEILGRGKPIGNAGKRETSAERAYAHVTQRITDSTYRTDKPLPKCSVIGREAGVSSRTMARAMRRLADEGLVHRDGLGYSTGPRVTQAQTAQVTAPSILIVVTSGPNHWEGLRESPRNRPFGDAFAGEANRRGVRLVNVIAEAGKGHRYGVEVPSGNEGLVETIRKADGRYVGALIVTSADDPPGVAEIAKRLLPHQQSVVWFDRIDQRETLLPKSPLFTCCRYSESLLVGAALEFLHARGHRIVVFPHTAEDWQLRRKAEILKCADSLMPAMTVGTPNWASDAAWKYPDQSRLVPQLEAACNRVPGLSRALTEFNRLWTDKKSAYESGRSIVAPSMRSLAGFLLYSHEVRFLGAPNDDELDVYARPLWTAVETYPLLAEKGATALIAARDRLGQSQLRWAQQCGLAVPDNFSLISFDNEFSSSFYPMTTVDPGFAELGYQAFHSILRDVPTRRSGAGVIESRPIVVDNGSVGVVP